MHAASEWLLDLISIVGSVKAPGSHTRDVLLTWALQALCRHVCSVGTLDIGH